MTALQVTSPLRSQACAHMVKSDLHHWSDVAFPIRRVILRWCLGCIRSHSRRTHPPNRRAGVSGAKKARMLMKVTAGLPAWFGSVGVTWRFQSGESFCGGVWGRFDPTRAEHTRPTVGRVCPAQKSPNAHEGNRRITRPVWESWGGAAFPIRRVILRWCLGKIRSHSRRTHPPYGPDIQPWAYA
jgi:hypothetical protein